MQLGWCRLWNGLAKESTGSWLEWGLADAACCTGCGPATSSIQPLLTSLPGRSACNSAPEAGNLIEKDGSQNLSAAGTCSDAHD